MRESQSDDQARKFVKVVLEENNKEMYLKLKKLYNIKYGIDVFYYILKKVYDIEFPEEK